MMGSRGVARAALRPACKFHPGVGNSPHPGIASPPRRSLRHQAPGRDKPQSLSQLREATLWKALRALRSYRLKFTRAQCVSKVNLNARKRLCALPLAPPVCFWPPSAREAARVLVTQFERESSKSRRKISRVGAVRFHRISPGRHSRGKRMGRHKRRPLGLSPIGLITNLLCPWPATGELVGSLTRMPPSARSPHTGAAASRWARSRSSNSASNFPAPHPSPPWPAFNDCRMPTRFSSRIRSSSRMVRPAACLSD